MKRILLLLCGIILVPTLVCSQCLVEVGKGYSCTSVNTAVFRNNSLVTHGDEQYISYYDNDGYLILGKRKLDSKQWTLHRTQYQGNVKDAHNVISMMVDGEGYIHVSFDHHGHKLNYCRSIAPGSLKLGDKIPMTGVDEGNVTYPEFYSLSGGDLLFVYRSGSSGRGNLVMNRYSLKEHKWTRIQDILIDGENKRNAYWQMYVDEKGTIHLSWVWRESWHVETNHDICYARPRIVVEGGEVFYIFRDEERGSRVSMAHASDVGISKWTITDLTDFSVDAWEPSHDTELWKKQRKLHLFVQHTRQGDGERTAEIDPQMVYVLETDMNINK